MVLCLGVAVVTYFLPPSSMAGLLTQASPFGSDCAATGSVRLAGRTNHRGVVVALEDGDQTVTDDTGSFRLAMPDEGTLTASHPGYLTAEAPGVLCTGGEAPMIEVTLPGGDLNQDAAVDMLDLVAIAKAYGSCTGDANFIASADLNASGCVDMMDLVLLGSSYGRHAPVEWFARPGGGGGNSAVSYARDVDPILQAKCRLCHGDSGGLSVKDHASLMEGGRNGPAVVPGNSEAGTLIARLTGAVQPVMPPGGVHLDDSDIELIRVWIDEGAANN
jgi:hypothetical protein